MRELASWGAKLIYIHVFLYLQSHMHEIPQKCAQHNQLLQITSPCSCLFPLIFHSLLLLLISCLKYRLTIHGDLDTASYLCYAENCRSNQISELCVSGFPHLNPRQGAVPRSGVSVPFVLDPCECGWWKSQTLSLRLSHKDCQWSQCQCIICPQHSALTLGLPLLIVSGLSWLNYLQQQP